MGFLTKAELREEVKATLGNRTDITDTRIDRFVHLAQIKMARAYDFEELERFTVFTNTYTGVPADDKFLTLDEDIRRIYSLRCADSAAGFRTRKLEYFIPRVFDTMMPEPEYYATGMPSAYTVYTRKFEFWKVPDKEYQFPTRYSIWPTEMIEDDDTSSFTNKDDLIVLMAAVIGNESVGRGEEADRLWKIFQYNFMRATGEDITNEESIIAAHNVATTEIVGTRGYDDPFVPKSL